MLSTGVILAALIPIVVVLFIIIFPIVKALIALFRRRALPPWLVAWLVGLAAGIVTVLAIQATKPSLFVVLAYRYFKRWPSYLPLSIPTMLGTVLALELGSFLWWLVAYLVLTSTRSRAKAAPTNP